MRIHLAGNHAGYGLGRDLQEHLGSLGHDVHWHGAADYDEGDDYPVYCVRVARAVVADEDAGRASRGVIVGGDGAGEAIAANKVNGARAVTALDCRFVRAARAHADANVLILAGALMDSDQIAEALAEFLERDFLGGLDDARRIVNIAEFESAGTIEGWTINAIGS